VPEDQVAGGVHPDDVGPAWIGRRVVLRYRRAVSDRRPPLSDAVGVLVGADQHTLTVQSRDGTVSVPRGSVVAARLVGPSRQQILELARISRLGWRSAEQADLDGWQLHADRGWTGRANSVLPLRPSTRPLDELITEARRYYAARGLPLQLQAPLPARDFLDGELARRGWRVARPTLVLTGGTGQLAPTPGDHPIADGPPDGGAPARPAGDGAVGEQAQLDESPDDAWLAAYHYRGEPLPPAAAELLTRHDVVRFASVRREGRPVGIARGTIDEGWLGITSVEVATAHRHTGVATALTAALGAWAREQGASRCYLQVDRNNQAALTLYRQLGFSVHHLYHYRVAPPAG
jgi:GNAT superfamily N-acetyltransferase